MKKLILFIIIFLSAFSFIEAQVPTPFRDGIVIGKKDSLPTGVDAGQIIWYTPESKFYQFDGSVWEPLNSIFSFEDLDSTQSVDIGDIGVLTIEDGFNNYTFSENIQNQADGYVIINCVRNGITEQYLFLGEGGSYGTTGTELAVEEDFSLVDKDIPFQDVWRNDSGNEIAINYGQDIRHGGDVRVDGDVAIESIIYKKQYTLAERDALTLGVDNRKQIYVVDTGVNELQIWDGDSWETLGGGAGTLQSVTEAGATTDEIVTFESDVNIGDGSYGILNFLDGNNSFIETDGSGFLIYTDEGNKSYRLNKDTGGSEITTFIGDWNASTNSPTLSNTYTGSKATEYKVSVAGTQDFGAGSISFEVGDIVANDGSVWYKKVDNNQSGGDNTIGAVVINTATDTLQESDIQAMKPIFLTYEGDQTITIPEITFEDTKMLSFIKETSGTVTIIPSENVNQQQYEFDATDLAQTLYTREDDVWQLWRGSATVSAYVPPAATNYVLNGTFDTSDDLTIGTSWSIGSGVASYDALTDNDELNLDLTPLTNGTTYDMTFEVTTGTLRLDFRAFDAVDSAQSVATYANYGVGTHTISWTATQDTDRMRIRGLSSSGGTSGSMDNVIITEQ